MQQTYPTIPQEVTATVHHNPIAPENGGFGIPAVRDPLHRGFPSASPAAAAPAVFVYPLSPPKASSSQGALVALPKRNYSARERQCRRDSNRRSAQDKRSRLKFLQHNSVQRIDELTKANSKLRKENGLLETRLVQAQLIDTFLQGAASRAVRGLDANLAFSQLQVELFKVDMARALLLQQQELASEQHKDPSLVDSTLFCEETTTTKGQQSVSIPVPFPCSNLEGRETDPCPAPPDIRTPASHLEIASTMPN
jgi:hypothetical protein